MLRVLLVLLVGGVVVALAWVLAGLPGRVGAQIGDIDLRSRDTGGGARPAAARSACFTHCCACSARCSGCRARCAGGRRCAAGARRCRGDPHAAGAGRRREGRRTPRGQPRPAAAGRHAADLAAGRRGRPACRPRPTRRNPRSAPWRSATMRPSSACAACCGRLSSARTGRRRPCWRGRPKPAQPGAIWLRHERARLAVRAGDWSEALALADADAPKAALAAAAAEAEPDPARALRLARQAWRGRSVAGPRGAGLCEPAARGRAGEPGPGRDPP